MLHAKFGTRLYEFDTELVLGRLQLYMDAIKKKVKVLSVHVLDYLMEQCILFLARIPKKDSKNQKQQPHPKGGIEWTQEKTWSKVSVSGCAWWDGRPNVWAH